MAKKSVTSDLYSLTPETSSQRILLEEFRLLHANYVRQRNEGVTRVNFYVTAMSVVLGGALVFVSGNNNAIMSSYFRLILFAALIILVTVGIDIYNFLIQRDIVSDRHMRGLARIRYYFVKLDPDLPDYFVNTIYDTPSGYLNAKRSGLRRTAEIIVCFLVGIALTVLSSYFPFSMEIKIVIGVSITVLTALFLEFNAGRKLGKALRNAEKEMKFNQNVSAKQKLS